MKNNKDKEKPVTNQRGFGTRYVNCESDTLENRNKKRLKYDI